MNITKPDVLFVLLKHAGKWVRPKTIARELNVNTTQGINRVSVLLYRLRNQPYIARRNKSHDYQYRYYEEIKVHPTNILPLSKTANDKKAIGKSDKFNVFSFIEPLPEVREGYCEVCESYNQIAFKAENEGSIVFLCEKHGKAIDKMLCGYGGAF